MTLAIVVTTYNRSRVLRDLLQALTLQSDLDFQVVVAIDGSSDDTETMLASVRAPYELKWVNTHCQGYGLAVARNLGILAADKEAVAILDDDSFPDLGYVAAHKQSVRRGVVTGGPRNPADLGNKRMAWKMHELGKLPPLLPLGIPQIRREWPNAYLIENNICMLRDDFIAMGMFSERLKMYGFIGQEFFGRAEFLGLRYQYNPEAIIFHHGEFAETTGLNAKRKIRETQVANFIRPSLMTPMQYRAQVQWAKARSAGSDIRMPAFRAHAALALPWRLLKTVASRLKRELLAGLRTLQ